MSDSNQSAHFRRVREIFEGAVEAAEPAGRQRYLAAVCAGDLRTLGEVEKLLRHHDRIAGRLPSVSMPRFGPYQSIRQLGRGGMGVVYQAARVDGEFERCVAVKVLAGATLEPGLGEGLRAERQILARFAHPNIAQLFDGGTTVAGEPYLVAEYIDGRHLDRYCEEEKLSARERLKLFGTVLDAVDYAHRNGVVHADLKPSNVLVDASGQPKLVDFGAARLLGKDGRGPLCLTPDYASPELLKGEPVDARTDVFALGVMYARLLGGQASKWAVRKATAQDRDARYGSVAEFQRAIFRNPWPLAVGAGLTVAAAFLWWTMTPAGAYRLRPVNPPGTSWQSASVSWNGEWLAYVSSDGSPGQVDLWVARSDGSDPQKLTSDKVAEADPTVSPDGMRIAYRSNLGSPGIFEIDRSTGATRPMVAGGHRPKYSPDGKWLLYSIADNRVDPARGLAGQWRVMPVAGGSPVAVGGTLSSIWWAGWSHDSAAVYFVGAAGSNALYSRLHRYDLASGRLAEDAEWAQEQVNRQTLPCGPVKPDGLYALRIARGRTLVRLNRNQSKVGAEEVAELPPSAVGCQSDATGRIYVPDGTLLTRHHRMRLPEEKMEEAPLPGGTSESSLYFLDAADGGLRLFLDEAGEAVIERLAGRIARLPGSPTVLSGDGQFLFVRRYPPAGSLLSKLSVRTGQAVKDFALNAVMWGSSNDGRLGLMYAGPSGAVSLLDTVTGQFLPVYEDPRWRLYRAAFSQDGRWVTFTAVRNGGATPPRMRIAPFRGAKAVAEADWIDLGEGRAQRLSPDGNSVYFAGACGEFSCIHRLSLHPQTKHPVGPPVAVAHFHKEWSPMNMESAMFRIGLADGALHFSVARRGDRVLRLDLPR